MEIFELVAPAKQMFFEGTMLCSGIFKQEQYYAFFLKFLDNQAGKVQCCGCHLLRHQFDTNAPV